jgi:hypothetical protein
MYRKVQGSRFRGSEVQRFKVQRFRGSRFRGSEVQRFRGSEVQGSEVQGSAPTLAASRVAGGKNSRYIGHVITIDTNRLNAVS